MYCEVYNLCINKANDNNNTNSGRGAVKESCCKNLILFIEVAQYYLKVGYYHSVKPKANEEAQLVSQQQR